MACFATPYGLRYAAHCFNRAHAQQNGAALIPAGGKLGVTSLRFNARGPDGLLDGKAPGPRSRLDDAQRQALVDVVERGPIPAIHGVVRWRLIDLVQWLHDEFAVSLDETTVSRELKKLGYVKLTARPRHHAQNEHALEAFKKGALLPSWQRSEQPSRRARP